MFLTNGGKNGIIVPINDVDAMAEAILKIIENPAFAKELEARGPEIVSSLKDEVIREQWKAAFDQIFVQHDNLAKLGSV